MPSRVLSRSAPCIASFSALHRELQDLPPGQPPGAPQLRRLARAWGNPWFSAKRGLLSRVADCAAATTGPVLECGSGLSTILVGMLTAGRDIPVVSLEHMPGWRARVQFVLQALHLDHVRVLHCPLVNQGHFDWYAITDPIPDRIHLVICDGPPGRGTRGGRYGLLPTLGHLFHPNCIILLDDAHRHGEQRVLASWRRLRPLRVRLHGRWIRFAEMTAW
jgi:hypothetical protein